MPLLSLCGGALRSAMLLLTSLLLGAVVTLDLRLLGLWSSVGLNVEALPGG